LRAIQLAIPAQDHWKITVLAAIQYKTEFIKPSPLVVSVNRRLSLKTKNFPVSLVKRLVSAVLDRLQINVLLAQLLRLGHSIVYTIYVVAQMGIILTSLAVVALPVLHLV